jgi:hypothetical protein
MDPFDFPSARKEVDRILEHTASILEEERLLAESKRAIHQALLDSDVFSSTPPNATWMALCETSVCLASHGMLPDSLTEHDIEHCSRQIMRRWKHLFDDPVFRELAISTFKGQIMRLSHDANVPVPSDTGRLPLTVYSAHDSTLYGLMHAFRAPAKFMEVNPPYASMLAFSTWKNPDSEEGDVMQITFNGESWWRSHEGDILNAP